MLGRAARRAPSVGAAMNLITAPQLFPIENVVRIGVQYLKRGHWIRDKDHDLLTILRKGNHLVYMADPKPVGIESQCRPKSRLADSAYSDRKRRAELRVRGVIDGICYKRVRGQAKLHGWQERWNARVAVLRARVEHPTAMMKQQLGYRRVRYRGRDRNEFDFALILAACNIKKSLSLKAA